MIMNGMLILTWAYILKFAATMGYVKIPLKYTADSMYLVSEMYIGFANNSLEDTILDTGSSDFIVTKNIWSYYQGDQYVTQYGSQDPFSISQSTATIYCNGWKVPDVTVGVANVSSIDYFGGILGVGYPALEAMDEYPNFPQMLMEHGLTKSWIYSINGNPSSPSVIFGAVDVNAYTGPLVKTAIGYEIGQTASRSYHNVIALTVNSISVNWESSKNVISIQSLIYTLDSGSNGLVVPEVVYKNLLTSIPGRKFWQDDIPFFQEKYIRDTQLTLNLTGIIFSFPISDIIDSCSEKRNDKYCSLRIGYVQIGVNSYEGTIPNCLFKYMYSVIDLDSNQVFLAPLSKNDKESIVPVSTYFSVETTDAPCYKEQYTAFYNSEEEVTLTKSITAPTKICHKKR